MRIRFYCSETGVSPVKRHLDRLHRVEAGRVFAALLALERYGFKSAVVVRPIAGKLWEVKVSQQRVFYVMVAAEEMVLLHAYKKQGQKAPPREIATAQRRMERVLSDKE